MRQRELAGQMIKFYHRDIYDTWTLATGNTGFKPFSAASTSTLRNYNIGQNFFLSQRGAMLALQASFHGASYASVKTMKSSSWGDILDAYNQIVAQGVMRIYLDSELNAEVALSSLMPVAPILIDAQDAGTPTAATRPYATLDNSSRSPYQRELNGSGVTWTPPILVDYGRSVLFDLQLPSGVTVAAVLNNYIMQFKLTVEEMPNDNPAMVRQ